MQTFYDVVIYFSLFSFCGWIAEVIYCSIPAKKFINRGFLNGPVCPVYGFGGLIVVYLLEPVRGHIIGLFLLGMVATTILEYATSYIMEKLFHTRWWDYSERPLNINGRVCLPYSIMFGALSVFAVRVLYPPFGYVVEELIPSRIKPVLTWGLITLFSVDLVVTVVSILRINGKLKEIELTFAGIRQKIENLPEEPNLVREQWAKVKESFDNFEVGSLKESLEKVGYKLEEVFPKKGIDRTQYKRLLRAFPRMENLKNTEQFKRFKEWSQHLKEYALEEKENQDKFLK